MMNFEVCLRNTNDNSFRILLRFCTEIRMCFVDELDYRIRICKAHDTFHYDKNEVMSYVFIGRNESSLYKSAPNTLTQNDE